MVYFEHNVHPRMELAEEMEILAENKRHAAEDVLQHLFQANLKNAAIEIALAYSGHEVPPMAAAAGCHARCHGWPSVFRCMAMAVQNHDAFIDRR